ncbi:putative G-protein coupled receptor C06G4.5 [Toxocara canis]|uniref:Putative G-protein coupled receptor C06G4.5 n=1 Tax=Toxocara canis TaxID=6265 RepID=A0A0B2VJW4_TOXCA|nr:putative G-protein coupled receptor C06G4.5 [Toxocara canis]
MLTANVKLFQITAMSFDRFVAVCHPHKHAYRSRKFILSVIAGVCAVAFLLLLPMLTYARANEVLLHQLRQADPVNRRENVTRVRVYKCSDMMPPYVFYWFTCRVQPRSGIPLRRVATYTILIAVFYFVCWTPYWCSVLYAIYMSIFSDARAESSELLLFVIYCVHLLPYFGSATNWILYGLLNTQLQMKHDSQHTNDEHVGTMRQQQHSSMSH